MNSRKAARSVPDTISRLLKSGSFIKSPPPAFYPILSTPPPSSLVRSLAPRPTSDLPASYLAEKTPYSIAKAALDAGEVLTAEQKMHLDNPVKYSRPTKSSKMPLPIVFKEDEIREQFFRDHPFEAYRPIHLAEGEQVVEDKGPTGEEWTELVQRSKVPTAEDAIAFTLHLHTTFALPLPAAYQTALSQFRTLRAEHETATRSAVLEAQAHGAIFFTEIQHGLDLEEKALDQWINAEAIRDQFASAAPGGATVSVGGIASFEGLVPEEAVRSAETDEFSGGRAYLERFAQRGGVVDAAENNVGAAAGAPTL
ncbi:mitochondrial ribosomal protein subunit Rsm25 [Pseudohyphozyma bogoriensis]|nr:mitochondrial ribosomal protein subunit Rsm25 [Pseudohyphozyma bogoriensis]